MLFRHLASFLYNSFQDILQTSYSKLLKSFTYFEGHKTALEELHSVDAQEKDLSLPFHSWAFKFYFLAL